MIARDADGKPDFMFIRSRYTGTKLGSDQGSRRFRSILRFRIVMDRLRMPAIQQLKLSLNSQNSAIKLQPLPIKYLKTVLVYQSALPDDSPAANQLPEGYVSALSNQGYSDDSTFWSEREYMLRLDDYTSQIFWTALQKEGVVLSVGYAFYAEGIDSAESTIQLSGAPEFVTSMHENFQSMPDSSHRYSEISTQLVKADAFEVLVDTQKWPDLLKQIDINEGIPPDYAALDVYCYDFNNRLRPDLYAKQVEIEATAVGGRKVGLKVIFHRSQPDLYAQNIRFPYAVRLDRPYRYRIVEIKDDEAPLKSPWIEGISWADLLDVTTHTDEFEKSGDE